ncbi:MAG: ATP-binding cassette domain-containing protein [Bacteroidota bacterium]|nr:ATP-binding cassette domain-containing protein [Bacteroidota bacterium]
MTPVILKNISKYYNDKKILDNISFDIAENSINAIIGRSGSGKSTILKIINGLIIPSDGEIKIFEKEIVYDQISKLRLQIGYSVQGTTLFPHMNVYENITLLARLNSWSMEKINERCETLMDLVSLPREFKTKYPFQLSGGEQQRTGICRAMMLDPKLFLLDEAFGALDPTTKSEIHKELLKIQSTEPRTIIMVTHDLHEAFRLADKIIVVESGVIQQIGTKYEILNSDVEFVKYFVKTQVE